MKTLVVCAYLLVLSRINTYEIRPYPLYSLRQRGYASAIPIKNLQLLPSVLKQKCIFKNVLTECLIYPVDYSTNNLNKNFVSQEQEYQDVLNVGYTKSSEDYTSKLKNSSILTSLRRMINVTPHLNMLPLHGKSDRFALSPNTDQSILNSSIANPSNNKLNMILKGKETKPATTMSDELLASRTIYLEHTPPKMTTSIIDVTSSKIESLHDDSNDDKLEFFDNFERKFYGVTFSKLTAITPPSRRENGMSFVQSGLFLLLTLMALSTEVDPNTKREIDDCIDLHVLDKERIQLINETISFLPASSNDLKFRWSCRLVLQTQNVSDLFRENAASALRLQVTSFNGTQTPKEMAITLNHLIELDSEGAIHNTFDEEDLSEGVSAVLITTLYLRARWRSAPTLLNGTHAFHDSGDVPLRSIRMIRVNDIMKYADLKDWDAEAIEIFYSTPGLSLIMLIPRGNSLRNLTERVVNTSFNDITNTMQTVRVAATLPLYTLRMTLLLPNKLEAMNISRLVDTKNTQSESLYLSHAVQRIMFWAEAGRNAFKDDGGDAVDDGNTLELEELEIYIYKHSRGTAMRSSSEDNRF